MFRKQKPEETRRPREEQPGPAATPEASAPVDLPRRPEPVRPPERVAPIVGEGKRLIVGRGISLSGEITACDRLVVEGSVQVTLNQTRAIEITETGEFRNGKAEVEEAEISGVYEGELTVRNRLLIRSTGRVTGRIRYGEIEIERGGRISGEVQVLEPHERRAGPTAGTAPASGTQPAGGAPAAAKAS